MSLRHRCTLVVAIGLLLSGSAFAGTISWNTQGQSTDVANGILSFDELTNLDLTHTYVDVCGDGYDIKVSVSDPMKPSTGDLNYVIPNSSITFEFFETGTTNPFALSGFRVDWRDDDKAYGEGKVGPFQIVDAGGVAWILDTSSSYFLLGASISPFDLDPSNGVDPDGIESAASGNWDDPNISFITDLSSLPIRSFSILNTPDWIAPTSLAFSDGVSIQDIAAVPLPAPGALGLIGLGLAAVMGYRRRRASLS